MDSLIKFALLNITIIFGFSIGSAASFNYFVMGGGENISFLINVALPILSMITYNLIFQAAAFVGCLAYLLLLPFHILRWLLGRRKQEEEDLEKISDEEWERRREQEKEREKKWEERAFKFVVPVCMGVYGFVGWWMDSAHPGRHMLYIYLGMGLAWGIISYLCLKNGIFELDYEVTI